MHKLNENVTILIAEDDAGHAFLIRKNLSRNGISNDIIHFEDGQRVMDFFEGSGNDNEVRYDRSAEYVLLLDVRMPKVDGIEVLRRMKSSEILRDIPVIMVTTTEDPVDVEKSQGLGCSGYVTKPVDYKRLLEALENTGLYRS